MANASPASRRADVSVTGLSVIGSVLVGIAALGGLALRFIAPSPMWLDEALSVEIAGLGASDMIEALRHDGHPSLYYFLLGFWTDLVGESNMAARSLSGVLSLATVPVVWAIGRRRSPELGRHAAVLALVTPYLLRYGTEARMYALVVFLVAAGWLAAERALEQPNVGRLLAVAVAAAALVHTHYWAIWVVGAAVLLCGLRWWRREGEDRRAAQRVGLAVIAGAATFVVWLGVFLDQLRTTGTPWADRARPAEIAIESMQAIGGNNRFEGEFLGVLFVLAVVVGAFGWARGDALELRLRSGPLTVAALALVTTLGIGGVIAMATGSGFEGRYAAVVVPFVVVLAARGIAELPGRLSVAALAVFVLFGLAVGVDEARRDRTQAGDVADAIVAEAEPGDVVAFCPDQVGPATQRALDLAAIDLMPTAFDPTSAAFDPTSAAFAYPRGDGRLVDWADYADTIAASPPEAFVDRILAAADGRSIWIVTGLGYKALGDRCETILGLMNFTHSTTTVIGSSTVFEPMMLTRHEPL